jgi:hypothetical protein
MPLTWDRPVVPAGGDPGRVRGAGAARPARGPLRLRQASCRAAPGGRAGLCPLDRPAVAPLAVYLLVFQHVPVERCRLLIADVTGALVSDGFVHSCLAKAASLAKDVTALIRALITASAVAGFDETTLRSGPAGEKKYVHGAFTELYSSFRLGTRSLDSMEDAGILPDFAGIVVSDRYQNYFSSRWEHIAGNQACLAHLLRDYEDCAETYPGAVWPAQAQRALRGTIQEWRAAVDQGLPAIPEDALAPLAREFRHAVLAGLASVPRVPGPKTTVKQRPGRELLEFCRDRQDSVLRFTADTRIWPTNNISERGVRPLKTPAEDLRPPGQRRRHPGPPRHQKLHRHRPQARPQHHGRPAPAHDRHPLAAASPGIPPVTTDKETAPPITTREWAECLPHQLACARRSPRSPWCRRPPSDQVCRA